uniref:Uncharacterized protein n=1 Tax=Aegilops tauschii subsp. strangulata TaxID=200361 RepID=A0A453FQC6_AEGTS
DYATEICIFLVCVQYTDLCILWLPCLSISSTQKLTWHLLCRSVC